MFALRRAAASASASSVSRRSLVTVSDLSARVKVATSDAPSATTSLTLILNAGARHEPSAGVANVLKNFAFKANDNNSAIVTVRKAELYGGLLSATLSREHLFLTAEFLRGDEDVFLEILRDSLFASLQPHELAEDVVPVTAMETNQALASPATQALELSHKLAFRSGLGASVFASADEPVSLQAVRALWAQARGGKLALVGTGIGHEELKEKADEYFGIELDEAFEEKGIPSGGVAQSQASKYYGGEERQAIDLHLLPDIQPTLAISYGTTSSPSSPELSVIPYLLGAPSSLKWTPGTSPLALAAAAVPGSSAQAFTSVYSDAALVTFQIAADGSKRLSDVGAAAVKAIKAAASSVDESQLKNAIAKAKFELATKAETTDGLLSLVAPQLFSGKVATLEERYQALDGVTVESVSKVLGELLKAKPTVVSVARLNQMAYADELGL